MAEQAPVLTSVARLTKRGDLLFALALLLVLAVLLLPVPPMLLSVLLAANLSLAMLVLLVAIHTKEPIDFNTFPSLLLVTTLFRLGLNVATTRQILLTGNGGELVTTFGEFVAGGNIVVGLVVFVILVIIQLVVVTKGSGRIAEVAARFTLDAMPGKQMAIDADLNAGLITEADARARRAKIAAEAEFYGAMDGASKFVKGDAIAGLIITVVNITAGILIGTIMLGMALADAGRIYTIQTIGDGLVSQIPSLLIAIGSGMLITKARSEESIGTELPRQFLVRPKAFALASGMVGALALVPGMPFLPFAVIATGLFIVYRLVRNQDAETADIQARATAEKQALERKEEKVEDLLAADRIGIEIGYRLIPLVDKERGGTLLDRITALRKQLARSHGLVIPPIRIKDNIQLGPNAYRVSIYGQTVAAGELLPDRLLAINGGGVTGAVQGIPTREPAFNLEALWIENGRRSEAETLGYAVTDPASVLITHLTEVLRTNAARLLNREDVQAMLDSLKREAPVLVKDIEANVKLGLIQKVMSLLLEEKVALTNLEKILEAISDHPQTDPASLAEVVRARLGPSLVSPHLNPQGQLMAIILHPGTETRLAGSILSAQQGGGLGISPQEASALMERLGAAIQEGMAQGHEPVLLCTAALRRHLRGITARFFPDLSVLSYSELPPAAQVEVLATLSLDGST